MTRQEVLARLQSRADDQYKQFNDRIANCKTAGSIGVRVPDIRAAAREVSKDGWQEYVKEMEALYRQADGGAPFFQEEHMVWGMVLSQAKLDTQERTEYLDLWVDGILSWADCDCVVSSMKFMKKEQEFWYAYCKRWLKRGQNPFSVRFALVALMQYFIQDAFIDEVLSIFTGDYGEDYYIKMAQAWALSVCFVKYRDRTCAVLEQGQMNPWILNKAISKCRESYRVSPEDKAYLKTLKQ